MSSLGEWRVSAVPPLRRVPPPLYHQSVANSNCLVASTVEVPPPSLLGRPHSLVSCRVACREEAGARPTLAPPVQYSLAQQCTVERGTPHY